MDARTAWSAGAGVVALMAGTNAVAWAVGASPKGSPLPFWPTYLFAALTAVSLYFIAAPLARLWPFRGLRLPAADVLDECIRTGREVRERIKRERLNEWDVAREAGLWTLGTSNALHEGFPAIADRFILAARDPDDDSGETPVVQTIKAKMEVLESARLGMGG
jgi:hypothetical protein